MKALTLTQPWATLVAIGAKRIETRSWSTWYSGRIAIHAAIGLTPVHGKRGLRELVASEPFFSALADIAQHSLSKSAVDTIVDALPLGAIVATAELVDIKHAETLWPEGKWWRLKGDEMQEWHLDNQERAFGDYGTGRYAWLLADVRPLAEPIPAKGALGLWEWTPPEGWTP